MAIELSKLGLSVEQQRRINVFYGRAIVGEYFADLVVNDKINIELKVSESRPHPLTIFDGIDTASLLI